MLSAIAGFNVPLSRDATKPECPLLSLKWCFQGTCFPCGPPTRTVAGAQICLSRPFGSRDGAELSGWEEAAFRMPMAWDLDPKDGGLQLMHFSQSHHVGDQAEPQRAAAGRCLPPEPAGYLSCRWLVAEVS